MTCRVAPSSARHHSPLLILTVGQGVFPADVRAHTLQMGETFLKKQPWPHLDRVIAEAGKQLTYPDVFSIQRTVTSVTNSSSQGWARQPARVRGSPALGPPGAVPSRARSGHSRHSPPARC